MNQLSGKTALVVGASRGLGRGVAEAFIEEGASVVAVARDPTPLADLAARSTQLQIEAADASDPIVAGTLLERHTPDVLALVAGATPLLRPVHHHTWETFSANWHTDVRMTFNWLREALLLPMRRGGRVIVMSSGAALQGSPLSGGYAGAKAAIRWLTAYAAEESTREKLGISFISLLPQLTPATALGAVYTAAYAARQGTDEASYIGDLGLGLTPEQAGQAITGLVTGPRTEHDAYLLTGGGLRPLT